MTKKRFTVLLTVLCFVLSAFAVEKNLKEDVTLVSFEQSWLDGKATLALKNNTKEEIRNVVFRIVYQDMSGTPLNYEEFRQEVTIAPGMTKQIDIPAYGHDRHLSYYKSEGAYGGTIFKVEFQLVDYNAEKGFTSSVFDVDESGVGFLQSLVFVILGISAFAFWIGLFFLVGSMARRRNRDAALWVVMSLLFTPVLVMLVLLLVGSKRVPDTTDSEFQNSRFKP